MKTLFSGAQPTGNIHLGNYIGAIKNWVKLQNEYNCIFSIVDLHSLSIKYNTEELENKILDLAANYIACGINPEKSTIFIQSHVKEHCELLWLLSTVTPLGDLNRMTQFKDKSSQNPQNINLGLYSYPVLQAADICLYRAQFVPVGEDQIQHIELTREIVRKFNTRFDTDFLPEPAEILSTAPRLLGCDGEAKMSKSKGNDIGLTEDDKTIRTKIMQSKTDPSRIRKTDPGNPEVCNIYSWHKIFSTKEEQQECYTGCKTAGIGCVDCKKIVYNNILNVIEPIRNNYNSIINRKDGYLKDILIEGGKKCRKIAKENMSEIKKIMGIPEYDS